MNKSRLSLILLAVILLSGSAYFSSWLTGLSLNPTRTADTLAEGSSIVAKPHYFFASNVFTDKPNTPLTLLIKVDSNGGSLRSLEGTLHFPAADMSVKRDATGRTICAAVTNEYQSLTAGLYTVNCTAPSGSGIAQINNFVTFTVTPLHSGVFSVSLDGTPGDYAVITVP